MKNKLIKTLLISIMTATAVSACNSGASSNNSNPQSSVVNNQTDSQSLGEEGGVLSIIGGNIEEAITDQVGSALWNLVTKGQLFPQTPAEWDHQALIAIQQNIQQIEAQLTTQNAKLSTIISDIDNSELTNSNLKVSNYLGNISDLTTNVEDLIQNVLPNQPTPQIFNSLITGNAQPFTSQQIESMVNYVNAHSISVTVPEYTSDTIDTAEQQLSCDPSITGNTYYILNNPTQNALSHPTPSLKSSCLLNVALNNAYTDLTQNVQLTAGSNIFYNLQSFDQMLDTQYLQIVQALTTAYYLDQLRLYLYVNLQPSSQNHISPLLTVDPSNNSLANLATAQAELQLAFNTRLSFIQGLFAETKKKAFNYYAGAVQSSSMENSCNFGYGEIDSLSAESLNTTMSANNSYGWDGQTLIATCSNKQFGSITTTTNISALCTTNGGSSYNLSSSNGYVRCGAGSPTPGNYGNYSSSNILDYQIQPANTNYMRHTPQLVDFWATDENSALAYNEDDENGNLDLYFINTPLVAWQYLGFNNGGVEDAFNNPTSTFVDIYFNAYSCEDCTSISSHWSYVDDGVHAYMISGDWNQPVFACLPNDNNCAFISGPNSNAQGVYPNGVANSGYGSYVGLGFSNGDMITVTQLMGHGDYNIQTFYNGQNSPIIMNLAKIFPNVSYN